MLKSTTPKAVAKRIHEYANAIDAELKEHNPLGDFDFGPIMNAAAQLTAVELAEALRDERKPTEQPNDEDS